jgi:hypothetical protein
MNTHAAINHGVFHPSVPIRNMIKEYNKLAGAHTGVTAEEPGIKG